ncbi:MAG: leucine-rich repeat domain-containing protein [Clostridia bacterium]|nr:leucine-rich repeat domain-containing protein [Clostridia bacterium]
METSNIQELELLKSTLSRKKKKRIRILAATGAILVAVAAVIAIVALRPSPVEDFIYEIRDGEAIIVEYTGVSSTVRIPSRIEGCPVTTIGSSAFYECYTLERVKIPDSVKTIDAAAFFACENLKSFNIPNSVTSIGEYAFVATDWYYRRPIGLLYHDDCLLGYIGTGPRDSFSIAEGTRLIAAYAFYQCDMSEVIIPDSVTSIGSGAFDSCKQLASVTFRGDIDSIADYAFGSCRSLREIALPDSIKRIGDGAFSRCSELGSIDIPNSVERIGSMAFFGCTSLTEAELPDSVSQIGSNAFEDCHNLIDVKIPDSVIEIGERAFEDTGWYVRQPNGLLYLDDCLLGYKGEKPAGVVAVAEGTRLIADYAFTSCNKLTSLEIPASVKTISDSAVWLCNALERVEVDADNRRYYDVDGVLFGEDNKTLLFYPASRTETEYAIPDGVESIGSIAFYDTGLTKIKIPASVKSIGDNAFFTAEHLTEFSVAEGNGSFMDVDGVLMSKDKKVLMRYPSAKDGSSYSVPEGVETIAPFAFHECAKLVSITMPDSVERVDEGAFYLCQSLEEIELSDNIVYLGDSTFESCEKLRRIELPKGITTIPEYTFYGCDALETVVFPEGLLSIEYAAFYACMQLRECIFKGAPPVDSAGLVFSAFSFSGEELEFEFTIYYTADYAELWSPNGETEWNEIPLLEYSP